MGNAESSAGNSLGLMIVAMFAAPFTGGASLALAGGSMAAGTVATIQAASGITASNQIDNTTGKKKDSIKEYFGGVGSGITAGANKLI